MLLESRNIPLTAFIRVSVGIAGRTGRCGVLAIATWAAWFWAAQGRLLTKKKEERKGRKGRFNILATADLRTQSATVDCGLKLWSLGACQLFYFPSGFAPYENSTIAVTSARARSFNQSLASHGRIYLYILLSAAKASLI